MPPKRGLVTGPGGYAGEYQTGWNRIWGNPSTTLNVGSGTPTGGQTVASAADKVSKWSKARNLLSSSKISERGIYEAAKKWGPRAMNWGKGIVGAGLKRFPALSFGLAAEALTRPGDIDELVYEAEDYGAIGFSGRDGIDFVRVASLGPIGRRTRGGGDGARRDVRSQRKRSARHRSYRLPH
jgi:hypothetical protein